MNEDAIRDQIAANLDLVEPGLTLIRTEYPLPNAHGTKGRIDVLARDRFGNFLVIEVKRTNQAARQAIHELLKYASLLVAEEGCRLSQVRCCLASVEWKELQVPLVASR